MESGTFIDLKDKIEQVLRESRRDFTQSDIDKLVETLNAFKTQQENKNKKAPKTKAELEKLKRKFALLFENAPSGYIICDEDLLVKAANNTFFSLVNINPISDPGKITAYIHPDSLDNFHKYFNKLKKSGNPESLEIQMKSGDADMPVKIEGNTFPEEGNRFYRLSITDLTEQKQYNRTLKKKNRELNERIKELNCLFSISRLLERPELTGDELLQRIVDLIPAAWQFPEVTAARITLNNKTFQTKNFKVSNWNQSAAIPLNFKKKGKIEVFIVDELPETDAKYFLKEERSLLESISKILGRYLQRKYFENKIKESEEHFRITLNSIGDAVISTDVKGQVTTLNPIAQQLTGWTIDQAKTKSIDTVFNIFHAFTGEKAENPVRKVLEKGIIVGLANHTKLISKNGKEYHIADSAAPIKEEDGKIRGAVMVFRDVTEGYLIRQKLKESELHLKKAQAVGKTGSWSLVLKNGLFKASEESYKIYGLDPAKDFFIEEIKKKPLPEYRQKLDESLEKLINGDDKYDVEFKIKRPDGTIRDIHSIAEYDPIDNTVTGFIQDITARKDAERSLKKQKQFSSSLIHSLHEDILVIDRDYRIEDINNNALKKFGLTRKEAIGKYCYNITHQNHLPCSKMGEKCGLERVFETGESLNVHHEHINKAGDHSYVDLIFSPVKDENGTVTHIIEAARDVTDLFEAQVAVRLSEKKFRNLFKKHSAIKLIIDPDSGNIIEANKAAAEFYGWPAKELEKTNFFRLNNTPAEQLKERLSQIKNSEETYFETQHRKKDGSICDVEIYGRNIDIGNKIVLHFIIHDITAKKKIEEQLKLLSQSVNQSPVATVITNRKGDIEYVNPVFCKITGYKQEEVLGKNPNILHSGYQDKDFYKNLWETILDGKNWNGVMCNKKKNGELYWEEALISPIYNEQGKITHFVGIKEDISERKKLMEDLVIAKEKAEESDRLKSAFLANMSHEIRTPMNGILGFTSLLRKPDLHNFKKDKYIDIIHRSGKRMLSTVNDIIEISKIEAGITKIDYEIINVNELIEELLSFFRPEVTKKNLTLKLEKPLPQEKSDIFTDRNKLNSVLSNLIKNSIKFTEKGEITVGCNSCETHLEFYIKDTGIGISEQHKKVIFDRFHQADMSQTRPFEGSGLGLSISKSYVEMLGGKIWLESEIANGSTFFFTIPFENKLSSGNLFSDSLSEKDIIKREVSHSEKKLKILIAEDDMPSLIYLSTLLEDISCEIIQCRNGKEAVEQCLNYPDVDLILMDLKMPLMDGYEAIKRIRDFNQDVIIITNSAYAIEEDKYNILEAGSNKILTKPIKKEVLFEVINNLTSKII